MGHSETSGPQAQGAAFSVCLLEPSAGEASARLVKRASPALAKDAAFVTRLRGLQDKLVALQHRYAERVVEVRAEVGECSLVCERLDGESLAQLLERGGRLAFDDAVVVCAQVCEALEAAHTLGLAHGNLSPERVVFMRPLGEGAPEIKVRAFGVGRPLEEGLFGVPAYLAPEQVDPFSAQRQPTPKSDQFALAALLAEMLTGRRAFPGATVAEVRGKLLRDDPQQVEWAGANPEVARRVRKALDRALSKQPALRYERLRDLVAALRPRSVGLSPEGSSRLQGAPIQFSVNASVLVHIQDLPTVQPMPVPGSQDETQPALRPEQIQVYYRPAERPALEVLRRDTRVTVKSVASEAETARSVPPPVLPPEPSPGLPPTLPKGPRWRAERPVLRFLSRYRRRRAGVLLGAGMALSLLCMILLIGRRPSLGQTNPIVVKQDVSGELPPPAPPPVPEVPKVEKGVKKPPKNPGPKPVKLVVPPKKPQAVCTIVGAPDDMNRALQACFSPSLSRLAGQSFTVQLDFQDNPILSKLPRALQDASTLGCLYQARGLSASRRSVLRQGLRVTCR